MVTLVVTLRLDETGIRTRAQFGNRPRIQAELMRACTRAGTMNDGHIQEVEEKINRTWFSSDMGGV